MQASAFPIILQKLYTMFANYQEKREEDDDDDDDLTNNCVCLKSL